MSSKFDSKMTLRDQ